MAHGAPLISIVCSFMSFSSGTRRLVPGSPARSTPGPRGPTRSGHRPRLHSRPAGGGTDHAGDGRRRRGDEGGRAPGGRAPRGVVGVGRSARAAPGILHPGDSAPTRSGLLAGGLYSEPRANLWRHGTSHRGTRGFARRRPLTGMFIDTVDRAARASRSGSMKSSRARPVGDCPEGWREALVAHLALPIDHRARDLGEPPPAEGARPVADRPRPGADAAPEGWRAEPRGRLPGVAGALAPRSARPRRAGPDRGAARGRLGGAYSPGIHPEPRSPPRGVSGSALRRGSLL